MLTSLNQKGEAVGYPFPQWGYMDITTVGGEAEPNPHCLLSGTCQARSPPGKTGKPTAREADRAAGKDDERSEGRPCNEDG